MLGINVIKKTQTLGLVRIGLQHVLLHPDLSSPQGLSQDILMMPDSQPTDDLIHQFYTDVNRKGKSAEFCSNSQIKEPMVIDLSHQSTLIETNHSKRRTAARWCFPSQLLKLAQKDTDVNGTKTDAPPHSWLCHRSLTSKISAGFILNP